MRILCNEFEQMLLGCKGPVERYVKFRLSNLTDAEDVLQEVYLVAYQQYGTLRDKSRFKAWLLQIAKNKCKDYFRKKLKAEEISLEEVSDAQLEKSRQGIVVSTLVQDTMEQLVEKNRQLLWMYYFCEMSQVEIAERLGVPVGTVKSRLHYAKKEFRDKYPNRNWKGEISMKQLPKVLPEYTITKVEKEVFPVKWEELMGWFIVPREGEKLSWGMYDFPARSLTEYVDLEVVGKAEVHGVEGVEIQAREHNPMEFNQEAGANPVERTFVAQLTDTHCRILAESHMSQGVRKYYTFLDGDDFLKNWGFGEDNCGNEVCMEAKGDITRDSEGIHAVDKEYLLDVVGRYEVKIAGQTYDTVCVITIETYNPGTMSEQYLDRNGRTILWRRFNRDDWAYERYGQKWSEKLPDNEQVLVNGELYVHWYDCVTDRVV